MGRNRELAIEDIQEIRVTSARVETEPGSTITVDLGYMDNIVDVSTSMPKDKII